MLKNYSTGVFFDEMFAADGEARPGYGPLRTQIESMTDTELLHRRDEAEHALISMGITFSVYGDARAEERIIPFDIIPRVITPGDWAPLEKGLQQRARALNEFLKDVYGPARILKEKIVDPEVVYSSPNYLKQMVGFAPPRDIWIHVSGTDLIRDSEGTFRVLEDNLRCPSGVSYVLENREVMKRTFPELFRSHRIRSIYDYPIRLRGTMEYLSDAPAPSCVVLTPGIYNSAYYEHSFLAQKMGLPLVGGTDLVVHDDRVYMRTTRGLQPVDVIYRRIDDAFLDPEAFLPDSVLGVPGLFEAYRKGNVALLNAPGTGVADDKVIYTFVPDMIRFYLDEEPIIPNVDTYLCSRPSDLKYVLENMEELVVKEANGAGGYGMLIGPSASKKQVQEFREKVRHAPRDFIAQPVMSLSRVPTVTDDGIEGRHVDLRPFILFSDDIYVMPGGLTRVALPRDSLVVNSSQGGGTKDTWVMGS
ncbi:MAG: circularly permuted type 2 ATP-grasp protein [Leptospiraceae bacterium]|nr:circularly permuted type 2 ATP-grasp protein [Leptospiraceae bacterium]MCB1170433.1 circularly permuted type 2 ATP-grasp protein [Leptospiraceae bacterium]